MRHRFLGARGSFTLLTLILFGCRPSVPESASESGSDPAASTPSVAFVVYDAGETLGLLPVGERLRESGAEVLWLPLTPWAADLLRANSETYLDLPEKVSEMPHVGDRRGRSDTGYWEDALTQDPPLLVVSGMVSSVQGQIASQLRSAGIPIRGFSDGFQPPKPGSINLETATNFDEIWVSTARVRDGFKNHGLHAVVAGQPTLESWRRASDLVDPGEVRRRQGIEASARILVFAGQYGPGYQDALTSFLKAVRSTLVADTSLVLVLSHHPRTDGSVEQAALSGAGLPRAVMVAEGVPTAELATISEAVITWTSTVGVQAAFMGRPVLYYSPPPDFVPLLVEEGAAYLVDESSLAPTLAKVLHDFPSPEAMRETLVEAGYVVGADSVVAEMIRKAMGKGE